MGYYTTVMSDVHISMDRIEDFHREVRRLKDIVDEAEKNGETHPVDWFWYYWDVSVDEDSGHIEFDETTRKWYEEEKFYNWLLKFNPEGSFILIGENLDAAVVIFKNGKWKMYDVYEAVRCMEKHSDEFKPTMSS